MFPNIALGMFLLGIYIKVDFIKRCEGIGVIVLKKVPIRFLIQKWSLFLYNYGTFLHFYSFNKREGLV